MTDDVLEISGEAVQADVGLHVARLYDHHLHIVCVCVSIKSASQQVGHLSQRTLMPHDRSSTRSPSDRASMAAFDAESGTSRQ